MRMDIGSQASDARTGTRVAFDDSETTNCNGRRREKKRFQLVALIAVRGVKCKSKYSELRFPEINEPEPPVDSLAHS